MKLICLPSLPIGYKQGFSGIVSDILVVGMGSLGKKVYGLRLDTEGSQWEEMTDFPYDDIESPISIVLDDSIWIFSGVTNGRMSNAIYQYNVAKKLWTKLNCISPVGLLGSSSVATSGHEIIFIGGYNEDVFNKITTQLQKATVDDKPQILNRFLSQPIESYQWNKQILKFDIYSKEWSVITDNPYSSTCGAASLVTNNELWLCDGEIKPGLRCTEIKAFSLHNDLSDSRLLPSIIRTDREHEGVAGAFSGVVGHFPVICGGAYFIGSQDNYKQDNLYTHEGLEKTYCKDFWVMKDDVWHRFDLLSIGKAYGSSEQYNEGLLLIGGELSGGSASCDCLFIQ